MCVGEPRVRLVQEREDGLRSNGRIERLQLVLRPLPLKELVERFGLRQHRVAALHHKRRLLETRLAEQLTSRALVPEREGKLPRRCRPHQSRTVAGRHAVGVLDDLVGRLGHHMDAAAHRERLEHPVTPHAPGRPIFPQDILELRMELRDQDDTLRGFQDRADQMTECRIGIRATVRIDEQLVARLLAKRVHPRLEIRVGLNRCDAGEANLYDRDLSAGPPLPDERVAHRVDGEVEIGGLLSPLFHTPVVHSMHQRNMVREAACLPIEFGLHHARRRDAGDERVGVELDEDVARGIAFVDELVGLQALVELCRRPAVLLDEQMYFMAEAAKFLDHGEQHIGWPHVPNGNNDSLFQGAPLVLGSISRMDRTTNFLNRQ